MVLVSEELMSSDIVSRDGSLRDADDAQGNWGGGKYLYPQWEFGSRNSAHD